MKRINNSFLHQLKDNKSGQIFLVCTVIITIYMLSFITIVYELNVNQYSRNTEIAEFQSSYENFRTETEGFMKGMIANYSSIVTVIDSDATATQYLQNWLDFSERQLLEKGYFAVFQINSLSLAKADGFISLDVDFDLYMECNYMTIDTNLPYSYLYTVSYTNTATTAIVSFSYDFNTVTNNIGYATVTINGAPTTNLYNGSYIYGTPLVAGDVILAITEDQIEVTLTV